MSKFIKSVIQVGISVIFFGLFFSFDRLNLLLLVTIVNPLVSIVILSFISILYVRIFALVSIFVNLFCFFFLIVFFFDFSNYSIQLYNEFYFIQFFNLKYSFGIDILSLGFIFLTIFLVFVCVVSVWYNTQNIRQNLIFIFIIQFLLLQVFSVLDVFFFLCFMNLFCFQCLYG